MSDTQSNEEIRNSFVEKWNNGEFEWNHHDGDKIGAKPISLDRVWNTFIEPLLTTKDQQIATAVEKERERIRVEFCKIDFRDFQSFNSFIKALTLPNKDSI